MRRLMRWIAALCLLCFAVILVVLIVGHTLASIGHLPRSESQSSLVLVSESAPQLSVYEAVAGSSYEIFIRNERTGQTRQLTTHVANDRFPVLSPAGDQITFISWRDDSSEIYLIDIATGVLRNLSNNPVQDSLPIWSPDGTLLAYISHHGGNSDVFVADVGRGLIHKLGRNSEYGSQIEWLSAGQHRVSRLNSDDYRVQYGSLLKDGRATAN